MTKTTSLPENRAMARGPVMGRRAMMITMGAGLTALAMPRGAMAQASGKVLRFGLSTFPPSIRPWDNTGGAANTVKLMIYRGLLGLDGEGKLSPELATSWEWADPTTLVLKLDPKAKFHNGNPVTAEDVVFSLTSITAEGSTAYLKSDLSIIKTVEAVDPATVKISLTGPSAILLDLLANYCAGIVAKDSPAEDPIGAGPYKVKGQERGVYIELERAGDFYTAGEPKLAGIRFTAYADENLRYAALEDGDVDLIEYLPWNQFDTVEKSDKMKMAATMGPYMFLLFNVSDPKSPMANPKVRQAIGYAIERQDVVDAAFAGHGKPCYGFPNPEGSPFDLSDPAIEWSYDADKAKALLTEAGYPNGFDCTLLATATYGMHQDTASVVQAYLGAIGINCTLNLPDWASRVTAGKEGKYDIAVHGSSGYYNDPDALWSFLNSGNPSYLQSYGFKSERIDGLLAAGRVEPDQAKRLAIYKDLAKAYYEEVPQVPLNWRVQAHAMRKEVSGFNAFPGWLNGSSAFALDDTDVA